MSNLSAFGYIQERSEATPGLFNLPLSVLSANIAALNSDLTLNSPSGNTFSFLTNIETSGGAHFQYISVGSTPPSYATTAAITVAVNSSFSDYLYLTDSSGAKSSYVIGSRAGNLADGLNIWDSSASTMIASFSKQSIRFFQQVVGPVFDLGGALTGTYNAATFGVASQSTESRIQAAINQASIDSVVRVYIPSSMYPYRASLISFIHTIQMVREGGAWDVYDVKAYGAYGDGITSDSAAFAGALFGANAASGGIAYLPAASSITTGYSLGTIGAMSNSANTALLWLGQDVGLIGGGGGQRQPKITLAGNTNLSVIEVPATSQGCRIENLYINGNKANQSGQSTHGIHFSGTGVYGDGRHSLTNVFIESTRSDGVRADPIAGFVECNNITVRSTGGHGFHLRGSDWYLFGCTCNTASLNAFTLVGTFHRLIGCTAYFAGHYGFQFGSSAQFCITDACDADSNGFDNFRVDAPNTTIVGCISRDPGLSAINTYSHMDVASGITGVTIIGPQFRALSAATQVPYLIRCNGPLYNSHIDIGSYESSSASNGILLFGGMTGGLQVDRPTGNVTFASTDTKPDVSGTAQFAKPTLFATNNASLTTINDFRFGANGQEFSLLINDANTVIAHSATSILLSATTNLVGRVGETITFNKIGGVWREVAQGTGVAKLLDGSATGPTYGFGSENSLGFYRSGTSRIGLSYGGLAVPDGIASFPGLNFSSESSLGFFRSAGSTVALSYGTLAASIWSTLGSGVDFWLKGGNAFRVSGGAGGAIFHDVGRLTHRDSNGNQDGVGAQIRTTVGSTLTPSYAFGSEVSLGWFRSGVSTLAASYGTLNLATQAVRLSMRTLATSSVTPSAANTNVATDEVVFTIGGASGASFCISSGGTTYIFSSTASAKNT